MYLFTYNSNITDGRSAIAMLLIWLLFSGKVSRTIYPWSDVCLFYTFNEKKRAKILTMYKASVQDVPVIFCSVVTAVDMEYAGCVRIRKLIRRHIPN